ncbi:hypothetical protein DFH06DRAFT_1208618 [Mycena polygramma]|nr:hypothetical protein DFH06DRAFT_1208618 [Mycena polygramma]
MPPQAHRKGSTATPSTVKAQCTTLLEDGMTRCSETPTHGKPIERCRVHHKQYQTMTGRYKEAQKFVDETLAGAAIPSKEDVQGYTSITTVLEKARLMKKYVNAIREERTGRDIHHHRFFLKVDSGHKIRIKVLAKQMTEGVEIRDALEARALALHLEDHPAKDWVEHSQTAPIDDADEDQDLQPGEDAFSYLRAQSANLRAQAALNEDDDLIALKLRFEREKILHCFEHILEPDAFQDYVLREKAASPQEQNTRNIITNVWRQYTRRIIFHDPLLFAKSMNKVSFKHFFMDDDFDLDDVLRIAVMYTTKRLKIGLRWWKDSWTEAIAIKDSSTASANMGNVENRIQVLGGWIYNNSREIPAPNKVWHSMLMADKPERDTENRYVRLCCNFDELHAFLSFSALVLSTNTPTFCTDSSRPDGDPRDSAATRNHLSLCGVVVADMVSGDMIVKIPGPVPSVLPAKQPGCITWAEIDTRAYMFGCIRNEPDDFTIAFIRELRSRPDLFSVVTRSDTDPPLKVESFGDVTDQMRSRQFEAPFQSFQNRPTGRGTWEVWRSAVNVLYGGGKGPAEQSSGYLSAGYNNTKGAGGRPEVSFFYHKRFPVKYFLILSATPASNVHDLARQVAWAAFRAKGLVQGNYDKKRYAKASDVLFTQHARERLSFMPEGEYTVANLAAG